MLDFNALSDTLAIKMSRLGPSYPYADEDYDCFHRRKLETHRVTLTAEIRGGLMNEAKICAFDTDGRRMEVLIAGQRARDYLTGLGRLLEKAMIELCDKGDPTPPRDVQVDVEITGTMDRKRWRDSHGKWRSMPKLVAAQWSYDFVEDDATRVITEGRLPSTHYAECAPA
tara:strand:- start:124 stop:633 length:510 start_codon:yes stop_codon:yes gene_type:complete